MEDLIIKDECLIFFLPVSLRDEIMRYATRRLYDKQSRKNQTERKERRLLLGARKFDIDRFILVSIANVAVIFSYSVTFS